MAGRHMAKAHHVVPRIDGRWSVRQTGASRASRVFTTQADAVSYARAQAQKESGELYIHRQDGTVRSRDSYGREASPCRDVR
jgi:hypothetical protein